MVKKKKKVAGLLAIIMGATSAFMCFAGCESPNSGNVDMLNDFADQTALLMMGSDPFAWNAFSATPEVTYADYGITRGGDNTWYSYGGKLDKTSLLGLRMAFSSLNNDFKKFRENRFSGVDAVTYRSAKYMLDTYRNYYNSSYAVEFTVMGGGYINSEGGYVADFASSFENFIFRDETDVKILLEVTEDTRAAFGTYVAYANDRNASGYPLYDSTITAMREYLDDVYEQGEEYYLYTVADNKLDAAEFLTEQKKTSYKNLYRAALTDDFMVGVKNLSSGLENSKGNVTTTDKGYLASYGEAGKKYYEWMFGMRTGNFDANVQNVYNELSSACAKFDNECARIVAEVEALETAEPEVYADFNAYVSGEKYILGLTDPYEVLDYLKDAAKYIVPDLEVTPEIDFKYMDDTVAERTSAVAYYVKSPLDETGAAEHITLNPVQAVEDPSDLLTTVAHEGYPGHLYAHVKSKETGTRLISTTNSCLAFGEGWAQYVELALLDHIAQTTDDKALKYYAEYDKYYILSGYINNVLVDIMVNYLGYGVSDFVLRGIPKDRATEIVEYFMENPAVYVPYGYGMYFIYNLHEQAKAKLGENYDEVKFNGTLLSEGFGPTLPRAQAITEEFIKNN